MAVKDFVAYLEKHPKWEKQMRELHDLFLENGLKETIKWGAPAYTFNNKNVLGLVGFKHHLGIWIYNGALLKKNTKLLVNPNEAKAMRQIRFEEREKIPLMEIRKYVEEAIQLQKEGKEIKPEKNKSFEIPDELEKAIKADKELKSAFASLTRGKQREYAEHIAGAKREETRLSRLEKAIPLIKEGKGLYDKYKNC